MLSKADCLVINHIIEQIYMESDFEKLKLSILDNLKSILPYVGAGIFIASQNDEHMFESGTGIGISDKLIQDYIEKYEDIDYSRFIFKSGRNIVYRESDYFSDQLRKSETYYRDIYEANGVHWCSQGNIVYNGTFLGVIVFYRSKCQLDFNDNELFIIELLLPHLSRRLWKERKKDTADGRDKSELAGVLAQRFNMTQREMETLTFLLAGMDTEQICEELSITVNTLKKHAASIYRKMGIQYRWELIKFL